jgi:hypothetical protein
MKRTLNLLLIVLAFLFISGNAAARPRKAKAKPKAVEQTLDRAAQSESEEEGDRDRPKRASGSTARKQQGPGNGNGNPNGPSTPAPVQIGPPVQRQLTKAPGHVSDVRRLPQTRPRQKERPELPEPPTNPILVAAHSELPADRPSQLVPTAVAPAPLIVFEGLDRFNWGSGSPPDTQGDAGPTYYIQAVNSSVGIYRKSDGFREAAFTFDTLMSQGAFGNQCDTENFGDPVVLYDTFEDRWVLTDFAFTLDGGGNVNPPIAFQCFAVSQTGNPLTGGWNFYSITISDALNDYPKFGIWPDGLYMTSNLFGYPAGATFIKSREWAFNKFQMYAGSPTVQVVSFDVTNGDGTIVPSNARLQTGTPPAGRPNFFLTASSFLNALGIYKFHVDWNNISLTTFTGPDIPTSATSWVQSPAAIPQSGTAQTLDTLSPRAMVQNQYTNFAGVESLWVNHTVRRNTGGAAAPRWYQVTVNGGNVSPTITQAANWDPDGNNTTHRWMGSLALDRAGNLALGYSTSGSTLFPSMKYAGRLATDPVNTFSYTEQTMFAGTASQTSSTRWGDYSAMTLDPDGCTFWYTTEYANPASQLFNFRWLTKIGSFRYPECTMVGAGGTVSGSVTALVGGAPIAGATVNFGARTATTDNAGFYSFTGIPAGSYPSISASAPGYSSSTSANVVVTDGGTTTRNFTLASAAAAACVTDTTQADFQAGIPTDVNLTVSPGDVKLDNPPVVGTQNLSLLAAGFAFTTSAHAQTFTSTVSGPLLRVDLNIFSLDCATTTMPPITVSIRNAAGNLPSGADLATATIPGFCNGGGGYFPANFAVPTTITAGTQYAIVWSTTLTNAAVAGQPRYVSSISNGNPYAGGQGASAPPPPPFTTWTARGAANNDYGFIVYVDNGYKPSGNLISSGKDASPAINFSPVWQSLAWNATTPASTTLRFQVGASNNVNGPFTYVGPDSTAGTFFTTSPASMTQFNGNRYLRYKALLATTLNTATPTVNDVTVCSDSAACPGPNPTITPTPASMCAGSTGNTATGPGGMLNYSWAITNGTITAGVNSATVTYTAGIAGTAELRLTVTEVGGCVKQNTLNVTVNAIPATPSPTNGGPYCDSGSGVTIQLNGPTIPGATYAWTGPTGFSSSAQNPTRAGATTADAGVYSLTVTVNSCTSPAGTTTVVINNTPATPTATNGGPYCEGQTIQLNTAFVSGATYSWTGPGGFTSALQNPTRSGATVLDGGSYSVTVTVNGCISLAGSTTVVVNATPATPAPTNTGPYCDSGSGVTVQLNTAAVAGATYAWTGPTGFTSALQNPTRPGATPADSGLYSVTVTVSGCTSAAGSTQVDIYATPATPTATNGGPYCEGQTIQLNTPMVPGATYAWTGPSGFTSSLQNPTRANALTFDAGSYSVTVTVNGCTSAAGSTTVVVNTNPATPTATNTGPYCDSGSGVTVQLNTALVAGATYAWTGPTGFTSALQNPTRAGATPADSGSYSVTVTVGGCTSAAGSTTVDIYATPATPSATNTGPYCEGATIQLNTAAVAGATYAWTGPGGFVSALQNPTRSSATVADAGSYSVTVTVNGCTSAAGSTTVVVNATPATPTATNGGPYCEGQTIQLNTPTVAGATYAWMGPSGFTSSLQNPTRANALTFDAGSYSVTVTVNGCTSAAGSTTVVVNTVPATPTATNTGPYCEGGTIQLNTALVAGATYAWTGPGGFTSALQNPTRAATVANAGSYSVTVTVSGCTSAAGSTNVVVNPIPATPTATNTGPYCEGGTIQLNTALVAGATYAWTGPGGFTSALQNPTRAATVANAGTYNVTVTVSGCTSAAGSTNVVVNPVPATPTASNTGPYCVGGTIQLNTALVAGATYAWTGPGGFTSSLQNPTRTNAQVADAGAYNVTVTVSGCTSAAGSTTVVVNPNPDATITAASSVVSASTGNAASVASAGAGATYNWSIVNGTITGGTGTANITYTAGAPGTLTLQVTVTTSAGCSDTKSKNVTVTALPTVTVTSVVPPAGKSTGGKNVTVNGTGFQSGATISFGGSPATNVVFVNSTKLTAKTPAHAPGLVNVTVTNPDTSSGTLTNGYKFVSSQFDANGDNLVDPSDIFYLVNFLFLSGPQPAGASGMDSGDANGDGVVDPSDIFYIVSYLFLGGPAPAALPANLAEQSTSAPFNASLTLGEPVLRGKRYVVPVMISAAPGSDVPQAMSLRTVFKGDAPRGAAIHRAGTASNLEPAFEISRRSSDALVYLVSFDERKGGFAFAPGQRTGVIAEIELDVRAGAAVSIEIDPAVTMLSNGGGTRSATVAAGTLRVQGTSLDSPAVQKKERE